MPEWGLGEMEGKLLWAWGQVNQEKFNSKADAWAHLAEGHGDTGSIPHLQKHLSKASEEAQTRPGLTTVKGTIEREGVRRYFQLKLTFKDINSVWIAVLDHPHWPEVCMIPFWEQAGACQGLKILPPKMNLPTAIVMVGKRRSTWGSPGVLVLGLVLCLAFAALKIALWVRWPISSGR